MMSCNDTNNDRELTAHSGHKLHVTKFGILGSRSENSMYQTLVESIRTINKLQINQS